MLTPYCSIEAQLLPIELVDEGINDPHRVASAMSDLFTGGIA